MFNERVMFVGQILQYPRMDRFASLKSRKREWLVFELLETSGCMNLSSNNVIMSLEILGLETAKCKISQTLEVSAISQNAESLQRYLIAQVTFFITAKYKLDAQLIGLFNPNLFEFNKTSTQRS